MAAEKLIVYLDLNVYSRPFDDQTNAHALQHASADLIRKGVWKKPKGHEEFLENVKHEELPKIRMVGG